MPAEQGIRLDAHARLFAGSAAVGEDAQPAALPALPKGSFDLARQNEELAAKQGIFGEEFSATPWESSEPPGEEGGVSRGNNATKERIGAGKDNV